MNNSVGFVIVLLILAFMLSTCIHQSRTEQCMRAFPEYTREKCEFMATSRGRY